MISEITLSADPNQKYTVAVPGDKRNIEFIITQSFNEQANYWTISIYDKTGTPIVMDVPLLTGQDLLEQYQYLNIGSLYVINYGDSTIENPDSKNIASNFKLLWVLI